MSFWSDLMGTSGQDAGNQNVSTANTQVATGNKNAAAATTANTGNATSAQNNADTYNAYTKSSLGNNASDTMANATKSSLNNATQQGQAAAGNAVGAGRSAGLNAGQAALTAGTAGNNATQGAIQQGINNYTASAQGAGNLGAQNQNVAASSLNSNSSLAGTQVATGGNMFGAATGSQTAGNQGAQQGASGLLGGVSSLLSAAAEGAIVSKPTMTLLGEGKEPEVVVPMSKVASVLKRMKENPEVLNQTAKGTQIVPLDNIKKTPTKKDKK
jgi:hypothetical protein